MSVSQKGTTPVLTVTCPDCHGKGHTPRNGALYGCRRCNWSGRITVIEVKA